MPHPKPNQVKSANDRSAIRFWMRRMIAALSTFLVILAVILAIFAIWTQIIALRVTRDFPSQGIFVSVTGGKLHLRDIGPRDAPAERTVIFIHGASGNHMALLQPLEPLLKDRYRIIAIDRPGHGHSDRPGGRADAAPTRQAALISEAMLALDVPRALVVAHSFGGAVGTTLAMDYPERVAGLLLLGPATHPWPGGVAWYYPIASHPLFGGLFSHIIAVPGASLFLEAGLSEVFQPQIKPPRYEEITALKLLLRPRNFMANAQDVAGLLTHVTSRTGQYSAIKAPVVIISGDKDTTVSTTIHSRPLAQETKAKLIILPDVGHMPHHADTLLVVREIDELSKTSTVISAREAL
jgi:pimeloyl-ACP methyl ester carboxylesterase